MEISIDAKVEELKEALRNRFEWVAYINNTTLFMTDLEMRVEVHRNVLYGQDDSDLQGYERIKEVLLKLESNKLS